MFHRVLLSVVVVVYITSCCCFKFSNYMEWELAPETFIDQTSNFIASILTPICNSHDIYQLNLVQLFFDPYSNGVMNRVLLYISNSSCSNKIVMNYESSKMGSSSGTQYYVVFCNVLRENSEKLLKFTMERQLKHGDARYIFVTFLNNGVPYQSKYFIRDNDRFRLHYLFMIKYDGYGWTAASFFDPFTRRERPFRHGQDIEQMFKDQLRNVHGYHFVLQYERPTYGRPEVYSQYKYFVQTMAVVRGGNASLMSAVTTGYFPDFLLFEDLYFDPAQFKYVKLLPMNQFRYLCAVTPALNKEVPWLRVFIDPFNWTVWTAIVVIVELLVLFIYHFGYRRIIRRGILNIHFEVYQTFINGPPKRQRTQLEEFVIGIFVLLCMVLMAVYESSLVSSMSMKRFYKEIDTVEGVNESNYPVVIIKHVAVQFNLHFKNLRYFEDDKRFKDLTAYKLHDYQHVIPCDEIDMFLDLDTEGRLHPVAEHFACKTDNFAVATFSPYGEMLNFYWNVFVEGDLLRYWRLIEFVPKYFERTSVHIVRPLGLRDMNIAWFVIILGSLLSLISYLAELGYRFCLRKPIMKFCL